jgi:hypothetical protein
MFSAGQKLRGHTSPELDGPTPHHAGVANDPSEKHAYCQSACSFTPYDAIRYHMCVQSLNPHLIPAVMPPISPYGFTPDPGNVQFARWWVAWSNQYSAQYQGQHNE